MTSRQKSLYLIARLYELAAEFTDAELREFANDQPRSSQSGAVQNAINALIELHQSTENEVVAIPKASGGVSRSAEASSLLDILGDRTAFPTVAEIARVMAIDARPKESRERYIARISRLVGAMESRERAAFLKRIADKMSVRPDSFIANWSKLIKEM